MEQTGLEASVHSLCVQNFSHEPLPRLAPWMRDERRGDGTVLSVMTRPARLARLPVGDRGRAVAAVPPESGVRRSQG